MAEKDFTLVQPGNGFPTGPPSLPTQRAAELAPKHRVPAVSVPRWFAEQGGLMSYGKVRAATMLGW